MSEILRMYFDFDLCALNLIIIVFFKPTWPSIDSRPLPAWYDDVKFGIFCHWGVYSVPAFRSEWFWWYWKGEKPDKDVVAYINKNYKPGTTYADFAKDFTAELFDAKEFADIVASSGAKYFVLTSKHHEGFTMWPSKTSWNWNAVDVGPKRDIVGELKDAFKGSDVHFGLYYSLFEWFHPMFLDDGKYNTTVYVDQVSFPQLIEIVNRYKPDIVWSDGDWGKTEEYWKSKEFLAWLYNTSPVKDTVVVNDRWGGESMGKHGGFLTYSDHYDPGKLLSRKWENCMTLDRYSWGHRRTLKSSDVYTVTELIAQLARTISCGGNLLLNVGPDMHGKIPAIFEDRLRELGKFINLHKEAIYGTKPWIYQNDTGNVWYTSKIHSNNLASGRLFNPQIEHATVVYAWVLDEPKGDIRLDHVKTTKETVVTFLGTRVTYSPVAKSSLVIPLSKIPWKQLCRRDVMVLKIENAASQLVSHLFRSILSKFQNFSAHSGFS
ncbi:unnamed protein product [Nippostrongylus brasiliensis]|uniref:Putative alpha-L-fucosidase n=1 Tax=Nippostrongylus brasiliensis TaxID=27835 RepID=A0A0N4XV48_NIPBR|nr:unnamed protein product [Nippostrongylus brasiliensis]